MPESRQGGREGGRKAVHLGCVLHTPYYIHTYIQYVCAVCLCALHQITCHVVYVCIYLCWGGSILDKGSREGRIDGIGTGTGVAELSTRDAAALGPPPLAAKRSDYISLVRSFLFFFTRGYFFLIPPFLSCESIRMVLWHSRPSPLFLLFLFL
ncbi:hypothetical protein LY76DRAFT_353738 [Colletotrichum caudatum]|nr:hypothetical protein LY76DRAFT_353738 [Colletotrichum caudatum]